MGRGGGGGGRGRRVGRRGGYDRQRGRGSGSGRDVVGDGFGVGLAAPGLGHVGARHRLHLVGPLDRDVRPGQVREQTLHQAVVLAAAAVGDQVVKC